MRAHVTSLLSVIALSTLGLVGCVGAPDEPGSDSAVETDGPEPNEEVASGNDAITGGTVAQAMSNSCTTASVKGLSLQIIAEGNCLAAGAYAKIPARSNLSVGGAVFPYLEKPARDQLVAALDAHKGTHMTINSALRTIAQQYLLYSWYKSGRCGIGLAASPGNSNHETGLALDVSEESTWRSSMSSHGFKWFGSADPVHFDFVGSGSVSHKGLDVKAFQTLWNHNHPGDKISVDGAWGPATEARMKKAPAAGFPSGPTCGGQAMNEIAGDEDPS